MTPFTGIQHMVTSIDDCSGYALVCFLKKSEVFEKFQHFKVLVHDWMVKINNSGEYMSKAVSEFFNEA